MIVAAKMTQRVEENAAQPLVVTLMNEAGALEAEQIADTFGMSKTQLASTAGLSAESLYKSGRRGAAKVQTRLREMLEIVGRITEWAGGRQQAMSWYRAQPIPAFGGRTAESLVKEGRAAEVRDYLDHLALGGFA